MTHTTIRADLLQALKVITQLNVEGVSQGMHILAVLEVLSAGQEPEGNSKLGGVLHDGDDTLEGSGIDLTSTLGHVDLGFTADDSGETTANTGDGGQGVLDTLGTINVGVEDTQNVLESRFFGNVQALYMYV